MLTHGIFCVLLPRAETRSSAGAGRRCAGERRGEGEEGGRGVRGGERGGSGEGMQQRIKVWYRRVDVQRVARSASRPRWTVALDGRPIQTPAKAPLELPTKPLALAVAMEWQAQTKMLQPHTMPLMKLATTSIDQIPSIRPTMHSSMLRTMETDVACMRADPEEEPALHTKEAAAYDALLDWLAEEEGIKLNQSTSLTVEHPESARPRANVLLNSLDGWTISALDMLSGSCKSFVLAIAVLRGRISAEDACKAARVAEQHQTEEWGEVEAGHDLDRADLQVRVSAASIFLHLLPPPGSPERSEL